MQERFADVLGQRRSARHSRAEPRCSERIPSIAIRPTIVPAGEKSLHLALFATHSQTDVVRFFEVRGGLR